MKYFLHKLKDSSLSLLPILLVVLVVHLFFAHFSADLIVKFLIALVVLDIGETLFLIGVDSSVMKMGSHVGDVSSRFSKIFLTIFFGFLF